MVPAACLSSLDISGPLWEWKSQAHSRCAKPGLFQWPSTRVMWFVVETPWSMLVLSPESPPAEKQVFPPPIFILPMNPLFNLPEEAIEVNTWLLFQNLLVSVFLCYQG